jgi:DNA polymerase elongation subunit (family B)
MVSRKTDDYTVECLGYKELYVYDIETCESHHFFANNILVHNSCYILVNDWCKHNINGWSDKTDREKIDVIDSVSDVVVDYINERIYNDVQLGVYNSVVKDFRIRFAKEKIAKSGLFVAKKKYTIRTLWNEGEYLDKISVTGLETVRGDSSESVRYRLKHIMEMILKEEPEKDISNQINKYKKELMKESPEGLAANIGVKNIDKWVKSNNTVIKGTPWHVKGVANYRRLLSVLDITNKYEDVTEGMKVKVVYIKPNQWNIETISFYHWPKEFDSIIQIDKEKMVEKFFVKKIEILLDPMNKSYMLKDNNTLNLFFS